MKQFIFIFMVIPISALAQDYDGLTGPAYAAARAEHLKQVQAENAQRHKSNPAGPEYAAATQSRLRVLQQQNAKYWGTANVGPAYAAQVSQVKANQRLRNGTWQNNTYYFSNPTVRIKPGYKNTPAFRSLNDPWMWYGQQSYGWWRPRY